MMTASSWTWIPRRLWRRLRASGPRPARLRPTVKRLRQWTGLVLFAYVTTHFANHSLGLVSVETMEHGRLWFMAVWRSPIGTALLYGSLFVHMAMALLALYRRRTLKMHRWEVAQLALGFLTPLLLAGHVLGTRGIYQLFGTDDTYRWVISSIWHVDPQKGVFNILGLTAVWIHACIGLHFWLRLKPAYPRFLPWLYAFALLLPVAALLGFLQAGKELSAIATDPERLRALAESVGARAEAARFLVDATADAQWITLGLVGAVLLARLGRWYWRKRLGLVRLIYPGPKLVDVIPGTSVLEASRQANIPHASVCGGRGRCSTCRIRVNVGGDALTPPTEDERRVLARVGAPPNVRLACQLRPTASIAITPLLPPTATPRDAWGRPRFLEGQEMEIAILFADLRSFTQLAEQKLPYDVVFLLNRYFNEMGQAIEKSGGHIDKFIGDGVMALFGVRRGPAVGCRAALQAARDMSGRLADLNDTLAGDLPMPLRMGIGIHAGPAIVGEMGYGAAFHLTAIGDAVNTASRLEVMTKEVGAQLVVSDAVVRRAGVDLPGCEKHEAQVRGRDEPVTVWIVPDGRILPEIGADPAPTDRADKGALPPSAPG